MGLRPALGAGVVDQRPKDDQAHFVIAVTPALGMGAGAGHFLDDMLQHVETALVPHQLE